jgi:hypothetical protein
MRLTRYKTLEKLFLAPISSANRSDNSCQHAAPTAQPSAFPTKVTAKTKLFVSCAAERHQFGKENSPNHSQMAGCDR